MRRHALALTVMLSFCAPAAAMVGGAATLSSHGQPVVMIVSDRGSFCTGTAIARDLVLTAAHCVLPGADYKLLEFDAERKPQLRDVASIARHPQFQIKTLLAHRATADVALLKLARPLAVTPAPLADASLRAAVGETFTVRGYGLAVRGDGKTGTFAQRTPVVVAGLSSPLELALGGAHTCAKVQGDKVLCWGAGRNGQLGEGAAARAKPAAVPGLTGAADLALGAAHSCALQTTGNVTCWGSDDHRALGPRRLP